MEKLMQNKKHLSIYACKDEEAIRFKKSTPDIRTDFFRDIDKIIYSLSYIRYIDKTQVFTYKDNDHISKRMIHVQMVSRVARTIGRALNLNEDLIEAAALGHDLGHVPFGHIGERILSDISVKNGEGYFNHNVQSARLLMYVEHDGEGSNLCLQTLDAIMCHNGEMEASLYEPKPKTKEQFLEEYEGTYHDNNVSRSLKPMTLEGCVVRISDIIAYIGRDIEDACILGLLDKKDIPSDITNVLGYTNSSIIETIVKDIIENSMDKPYIKMTDRVFNALTKLKKFNYEHIYSKANTKEDIDNYTKMFNELFDKLLYQVENNIDSNINKVFLKNMSKDYMNNTSNKRKVIDYIAGMTDDYFINEYKLYCK